MIAQAARDFASGQGLEPKEYFVYFEATNRSTGAKDPLICQGSVSGETPN